MGRHKKEILRKLAQSNIRENRVRNRVLVVAIAAVSVMLLTVMGSGISYFKNFSVMNTRLKGTNAQGFIHNISEEQAKKLRSMKEVGSIGKQYFVGTADSAGNDRVVAVSAYDDSEWDHNIFPTIKDFKGRMPSGRNEILLSEEAMKCFHTDQNPIGSEVTLTLAINGKQMEQTFLVVGTFHDFVVTNARSNGSISGNVLAASLNLQEKNQIPEANCVVSEEFAAQYCKEEAVYLTFRIHQPENIAQTLGTELELEQESDLMIVQSGISQSRYLGIVLAAAVGIIISLCGYLCIYNIMNIALIKDIHFWGNIRAIGTDSSQLKSIIRYQTNYFAARGIPAGIAVGAVLTVGFVPLILKTAVGSGGYADIMPIAMRYNVWVFLITILFCYFTVYISFRRSLKILSAMTPIEALRYNGETGRKSKRKKREEQKSCGGKIYRMAWNNVYHDKKKFYVVISTLFMGLFVFLLSYTLFSSPDWELYLDKEAPDDFTIIDFNVLRQELKEQGEKTNNAFLNDDVYAKLQSLDGIEDMKKLYLQPVSVRYQECFSDYTENVTDLSATAAGIGTELLKHYRLADQADYKDADLEEFESGETVYINASKAGTYPDIAAADEITLCHKQTGQEVSFRIAGILQPTDGEEEYNPEELGATTMTTYLDQEEMRIFMSENGIRRLTDSPSIYKIQINVDPQKESYVKESVREIIGQQADVTNRSDLLPAYQPVAKSFLVIGAIFSSILLIIGIMNFINSLCTSIYTREKELAVLSGIGMSKRQIIKMLTMEGSYYAFITIALLGTVGTAVIYLFMTFTKEQFYFLQFVPPVPMLILLLILLCMICVSTPWITYRSISKHTIVERLKSCEE